MRLHDIEKAGSKELFHDVRKILKSSWAVGALAGLCLAILALREESLMATEKLLLFALITLFALILVFQYWWATRRVLPELEGRCSDVRPPESEIDKTEEFKRQKRSSRIGMGIFLFSIPVFLVAALLGYPPFSDSGLPTLAGWLIIVGIVAPGLFLILKSAQCPACRKMISASHEGQTRCRRCGAKIRDDA